MGLAYLPDGSSMDYKDYIATHPHWQAVRYARLKFDQGECVVCHKDVSDGFETHHLNYNHLGNEHLTDVITMCDSCHKKFHNAWSKSTFWKGREDGHWDVFSIGRTAQMCAAYYREDRLISKNIDNPNLCNKDVARQYVDEFFKEFAIESPVPIDPNDLTLFVRNKRYELLFDAEAVELSVEQFLDDYYGPKVRGKNPIRQEAQKFFTKHELKAMHRHYKENKNLNQLMEEAKKYEYKMEDF